jgi:hypothetical protein
MRSPRRPHPADSAAALLHASTADTPGPGAAAAALSSPSHSFAPDELRNIVRGMLSGDRRLQRRIADEYISLDCRWWSTLQAAAALLLGSDPPADGLPTRGRSFTHPLGTTRGRDGFYLAYRCATTLLAYDKLDFRETIVQVGGSAMAARSGVICRPGGRSASSSAVQQPQRASICPSGLLAAADCLQGDRAVILVNVYLRSRLLDPLKLLPGVWWAPVCWLGARLHGLAG